MTDPKLDKIHKFVEFFDGLAERYRRLWSLAITEGASESFKDLVVSAGMLARENVKDTAEMLEMLRRAGQKQSDAGNEADEGLVNEGF